MIKNNKLRLNKFFKFLIPVILLIAAIFVGYSLYQKIQPDEKKILGTWYYVYSDILFTYKFNSDQTMTLISQDFDKEEKNFEAVFTYELKDQLVTADVDWGTEIEYEYNFDKGNLYIKEQNENVETDTKILCRTINKAKKNSESYHFSNDYLTSIADKNGFAIKDKVLYAYFGDEREVQTPKNITEIASCAFSSDFGRGEKLQKVTITGNVKKIDERAFSFTNAKVIVIEEGVEELGELCFMDSYIREIYFPSSIKTIGSGVLETEEGLMDTVIHCVENSIMAEYLANHMPYGTPEIKYDYEDYFK